MNISDSHIRFAVVVFGAFLVAGCGERPGALEPSVTDSAGIQILRLPEGVWEAMGALELSPTTFSVGALEGSEDQILYRVAGGVKLSDGRVAILNGGDQQVAFFGADGAFLRRQGGGGEGPGEYAWPVGIWATPGDTVLVWDRRLHRVTTMNPDGSYARDVPVPRDSGTRDVVGAFDVVGTFSDGSFLVFQEHYVQERLSANQQFQGYYSRFSSAGDSLNSVGEFPWRQIITMPPQGAGGGMQIVQAGPPRFDAPTEVAVTRGGLWVGTTKKEEILWLDPSGEVRRIVRWPEEDRTVTEDVKNAFIAELAQRRAPDAPPGQGVASYKNLLFAEELPAHGRLVGRDDGGLWMEEFHRPGTEPSNRWKVFGATGRPEGSVELPPSGQVLWAGEGEVLLLETDELGVEYVRLYTVRSPGRGHEPQPAGTEPEVPFARELQRAVEDALREGQGEHNLGLSASILIPGYEIWSGVAGDSHPGVPVSPRTLFDVGSVAKTFEAALVLALAEEGLLGLDDPVSNWLPPLRHVDGSITIRQLLNHTSGVFNVFENPTFPWIGADVEYDRKWGLEEEFSTFVLEPYGSPGSVQHYSSTNYRLITEILEETMGHPVPDAIERRFLEPLGLEQTFMTMGPPPPGRFDVAHPWVDVDEDGDLDDLAGHSRAWIASLTHPVLFTTPADLVRWISSLYRDHAVLSEGSLEAMMTYPHPEKLDPEGGRYGLGVVDFSEILGTHVAGHAGSALGYSAAALYMPEHGVAMAWAFNTGESPAELANTLMRRAWRGLSTVILEHLDPAQGS